MIRRISANRLSNNRGLGSNLSYIVDDRTEQRVRMCEISWLVLALTAWAP